MPAARFLASPWRYPASVSTCRFSTAKATGSACCSRTKAGGARRRRARRNSLMANITTCLWFDGRAEEAAEFYVRVFAEGGRSAKIGRMARYGESAAKASGQPEGTVMTVEFELAGNKFLGLNGGPIFKFSPATSF